MKNLVVIIGLRRSGLHAVGNWLIGHFPGRVRFVNDPDPALSPDMRNFPACYDYDVGPDKIRLRPTLHLLRVHAQDLNRIVANKFPWPWRNVAYGVLAKFWHSRLMNSTYPLPELDGTGDAPPDTHIILFENLSPAAAAQVLPGWLAAYRVRFELPPVECENLITVLRSPWNCLASTLKNANLGSRIRSEPRGLWSRLKRLGMPADNDTRFVPPEQIGELWTAYAKEITGETRHLVPSQWEVQHLLYDTWITTPELRASIAGSLGRPPNDQGLSRTATYGGGSSFDRQQNVASRPQDLTNRWRQFQHHPLMRSLLASAEIARLATALEMGIPVVD